MGVLPCEITPFLTASFKATGTTLRYYTFSGSQFQRQQVLPCDVTPFLTGSFKATGATLRYYTFSDSQFQKQQVLPCDITPFLTASFKSNRYYPAILHLFCQPASKATGTALRY